MGPNVDLEADFDGLDGESDAAPPPPSRLVQGPNGLRVMPSRGEGREITQEMVNAARDEGYFG
jgi:hypothetical protein